MKRKFFTAFLVLEALACVALAAGRNLLPEFATSLVAFPMEQIGYGLRQLSLSGCVGNGVAIVLYVLLSLLPLLLLWKKERHWEDVLPILMSALLFLTLYCMINPGQLSHWAGNPLGDVFEKMLLGGLFYCLLLSHCVLQLLRKLFTGDNQKLMGYCSVLLGGLCLVLVYRIFGSSLMELQDSIAALYAGNVGNEAMLTGSCLFLVLRYGVDILPSVWNLGIVAGVNRVLHTQPHSAEAVAVAEQLAGRCRTALVSVVMANLGYHVLQLLFVKKLVQTNTVLQLPLLSLLFLMTVLLMCRLLRENQQLKDDNDLFI